MMDGTLSAVQRLTAQIERGVDMLQRIADTLEVMAYYKAKEHVGIGEEEEEAGHTSLSDQ